MDFSDNQALSTVAAAIDHFNPDLVILRFYQTCEHPGGIDWTKAAVDIVRAKAKLLAGYWWPYHGTDVRKYYDEVWALARALGALDVPIMASDIEDYPDWHVGPTIPNADEVLAIGAQGKELQVQDVYYSSPPMWKKAGSPSIGPDSLSWGAGYINAEPADISGSPQYGGLTPVGWQWTSTPLDLSLFLLPA